MPKKLQRSHCFCSATIPSRSPGKSFAPMLVGQSRVRRHRMAARQLDRLLLQLEQTRDQFGRDDPARAAKVLSILEKQSFRDVPSLIRFHEALLFLRAFPHDAKVLRKSEGLLRNFNERV